MTKTSEAAAAPVLREKLPVKAIYARVDTIGQITKRVVIEMEETGLSLQDIMDDGKLLRGIQANRQVALSEDDRVEFHWLGMRAYAVVDYADHAEVRFLKPDVKHRGERDREPWQDQNFAVRPVAGGWSYYRKKDNQKMTGAVYPSWEAAKSACIREQQPARV